MTQANAASGQAPRRRWWRRRRVGLIFFIALVAVGYWVGTSRLDDWLMRFLESRVRSQFGGELTFERFELRPSRLQVYIEGAHLRIPDHPAGAIDARLRTARVQIRAMDLIALGSGRVRFSSLELDRPELQWIPSESRTDRAPPAPEGIRPWEIRIGRLSVTDGAITYRDRTVPWQIEARQVELQAAWSRLRSTLEGRAEFGIAIERPPLRRPLQLHVASRFRLDRHGVEIRDAQIVGDGLTGSFAGSIGLDGGASITGRGDARWELERLHELLPEGSPRLRGSISTAFTAEAGPLGSVFLGSVEALDAAVDAWHVDRISSRARLAAGRLELSEIAGEALRGSFEGAGELSWSQGPHFELLVNSNAVRLDDLLDALEQGAFPFDGALTGSAQIVGNPLDRSSWNGSGKFRLTEATSSSEDLLLSGPAEVTLRGGRLRLDGDLQLSASRARTTLEVDLAGRTRPTLSVEGSTTNFRDAQLTLMQIVRSVGEELPAVARERLDGSGRFDARLAFGPETSLALMLSIEQGHFGRQSFERMQLELALANGRLTIDRLELTDYQQHLAAQATLTVQPFSVESATLTARGVSMDWLTTAAGLAIPARGTIDAELSLSEAQGGGRVLIREGEFYDQPFDMAEGTLRFGERRIELERWRLQSGTAVFEGDGSWVLDTHHWLLNVTSGRGELATLPIIESQGLPIGGGFELSATLHDEGHGIRGSCSWTLSRVEVAALRLSSVSGSSSLLDGRIESTVTGVENDWRAHATIAVGPPARIDAHVNFERWVYEVDPQDPDAGWGLLTGAAQIAGPLGRPEALQVDGRVEALELWRGNQSVAATAPFNVQFEAGRILLSTLQLAGAGTSTEVDLAYTPSTDQLEARATGTFDLGLLVAGMPEVRAGGAVAVDLRIEGPLARPRVFGELRGESGRVQWLGFAQRVDELNWRARFDESRVELDGLRARLGNGEIRGDGQVEFSLGGLGDFSFEIAGANVRLEYPEGFRGIYEGELSLAGTTNEAKVAGEIRLLRGIYEDEFGFGGGATTIQAAPDTTLPDWIDLDVDIHAADGIWVRNELAQLQASLDLNLGGSLRRPQLTGRALLLEGGELRFRDVEYDVVSGSLELLELERIDPYVTLRARTEVDDYTIYLRVEGTASRFEFDLTSEPSLATPDIIALLTTGRTLGDASGSGSSAPSGDLAANYFGGALTGPFERQLEKLLGLKRVRIDPLLAEGESDPTTRLTLGQEVTDEVFVIFSTDLTNSENQLYSVNWKATPRFRVGVERDTQGGVGGDVRYTTRFWLRKPPPSAAAASDRLPNGANGQELRVESIRIDGVDAATGNELRQQLPFSDGARISRTAVFRGVESLKRWCVRHDLLESKIDASVEGDNAAAQIVYRVDPGPVVNVRFVGLPSKRRKLLIDHLESQWIDAVFIDELYEDTRQAILMYFQDKGHYAVDVTLDRGEIGTTRSVTYHVDLGRPVRIGAVEIVGMQHVDPASLRATLELRPTTMLSRRALTLSAVRRDAERIRAYYRNEGFLDVRVAEPRVSLTLDGGSADVRFELEEGPRFLVDAITFDHGGAFSQEVLEDWASIHAGDSFSGSRVLQAESRLRAAIDAAGFPDVRVSGLARLEGTAVKLGFQIVEGERQSVNAIEISGNRMTQDKIIRRELKLKVGDDASRDGLLRSQHALYRLGIFRNVRLTLEPIEEEGAGARRLRVELEEEPPMSSTVGVGWDSEARARLGLSLTHDNVGGYDRVLSVQGKISDLEERIQLIGEEPRFFNRDLKALASVGYSRDEEEGFVVSRAASAFRVEKVMNPRWRALVRYSFQRVNLSDVTLSPSELQDEKLVDGRLGDLGLTLVRDTRDSPFSPTRGSYFTVGSRVFSRRFGSEFDFVKTSSNVAYLFGLSPRMSLATGVRAGVAIPYGNAGTVPVSEAFFAGGDSTVRGFERDTLGPAAGGEAMLVFNEELRFPIWSNLRGVLFYDAGNVWLTRSEVDSELRQVLGAGLRFETPVGPLRLEYGGKLDRRAGESIGEFFLAIGNAF